MEAVLYASVRGALILVPECFSPSHDLEHAHGLLLPCGKIGLEEDAFPDLCRRIGADFDRMSYCVLGARDADRLFAAKALWTLYERRRKPRETKRIEAPLQLGGQRPEARSAPTDAGRRTSAATPGMRFWALLREFLHLPAPPRSHV